MAKAKKTGGAERGATKKLATETKKAAPPKTTKAAASTTKAAASAHPASAGKSPPAGGSATRKKAPAKPAGGSSSQSMPLIDTSLAAETAAIFVVNRALLGNAGATPPAAATQPTEESQGDEKEEKRESSTFKQLKAGLNKPANQGLGGILGTSNQGKKGNTGFGGGNQQVGRNQTFGADVNRSGVPRRTGG